jgi:hypothetical protein
LAFGRLRHAAIALIGTSLLRPAMAEVSPHALINVSQELLRIYNAGDAAALHGLLAPSLQARYSAEELRLILAQCGALTHDIERFSIPSWGGRRHGFFGVYAENSVLEMILEIDKSEKIVHWLITDDVGAKEQQCILRSP